MISQKVGELADYLLEKRKTLNFSVPSPDSERVDSAELREKILDMSYDEWGAKGNSKGTLFELKKSKMGRS